MISTPTILMLCVWIFWTEVRFWRIQARSDLIAAILNNVLSRGGKTTHEDFMEEIEKGWRKWSR